jgi:hypothetical protein
LTFHGEIREHDPAFDQPAEPARLVARIRFAKTWLEASRFRELVAKWLSGLAAIDSRD